MLDTKIRFVLKNGEKVEVKPPNRIGVNYGTSWLLNTEDHREGCRDWNIDVIEVIGKFLSGKYYTENAYFVVGEWGSSFNSTDGVKKVIFLSLVNYIELLK
jgi:hypothetical protein